jgi:hypothetical protein
MLQNCTKRSRQREEETEKRGNTLGKGRVSTLLEIFHPREY